MGSVFLTRGVLSDRVRAALKVLHSRDTLASRERFIREVDTLASLDHPAIVRVLSGGDDPERGLLYLFMEYVEGEDLKVRLARGPLSPTECYNLFRQVASGLQHAHERGVTHRDIKPANIMLVPGGAAKLVDFGIAAAEGRTQLTQQGALPGTLPYIDPVAFSGVKPDPRLGDIYALGLVLWECLTGREAFPEEPEISAGQQMVRMMREKLQSDPMDPGPAFPDPLRRLVMRATDPDPAGRLPDMAAFLDGLERAFSGRPAISAASSGELRPPSAETVHLDPLPRRATGALPVKPKGSPWRWVLAVAAVAAIALFGLGVIGAGGLYLAWTLNQPGGGTTITGPMVITSGGATDVTIPSQPMVVTTTADAEPAETAKLRQTTTFGPYKLTVHSMETKSSISHEVFQHKSRAGWELLLVKLTLENTSKGDVSLMSPFSVIDRHPFTFDDNVACGLALSDGLDSILGVDGKAKVTGRVCFEVPTDAKGLKLRFQPDMMNASWNLQVDLGR